MQQPADQPAPSSDAYRGRPPGPYRPGSAWRTWLRLFNNFLVLRKVTEENEKRLVFLQEIGESNYELLEGLLQGKEAEKTPFDELCAVMEHHFQPKKLILAERFRLMSTTQKPGQPLSEYYASLQQAAKDCDFASVKDVRDTMITMVFVGGIQSVDTRKRLLELESLTSQKALETAEAFERVGANAPHLKEGIPSVGVAGIQGRSGPRATQGKGPDRRNVSHKNNKHFSAKSKRSNPSKPKCRVCGRLGHNQNNCYVRNDAFCKKCRRDGHMAAACTNQGHTRKDAHEIYSEAPGSRDEADYSIGSILLINSNSLTSTPEEVLEQLVPGQDTTSCRPDSSSDPPDTRKENLASGTQVRWGTVSIHEFPRDDPEQAPRTRKGRRQGRAQRNGPRSMIPKKASEIGRVAHQSSERKAHTALTTPCKQAEIARRFLWEEDEAKTCKTCAVFGNNPTKTPLHPWEQPQKAWQRLHMDFCESQGGDRWLVVVDAKSKWPEVRKMNSTTAARTAQTLQAMFATHGLPEQIVSDNGPQFASSEFRKYCENRNIDLTLTPAYHPNSNGEAERFVQTFKQGLYKSLRSGKTTDQAVNDLLFQYRVTPHPATDKSPAEMLMGRQLRTTLDFIKTPRGKDPDNKYRSDMKKFHDQKTREKPPFKVGDEVYMRNYNHHGDKWIPAIITEVCGPKLYQVHYGTGQRKVHTDQLKKKLILWEDIEDDELRMLKKARAIPRTNNQAPRNVLRPGIYVSESFTTSLANIPGQHEELCQYDVL